MNGSIETRDLKSSEEGVSDDDGKVFFVLFRLALISKQNAPSVVLFERSVLSDRYCFARNCSLSGLFNPMEWSIYKDWHTYLLSHFQVGGSPSHYVTPVLMFLGFT